MSQKETIATVLAKRMITTGKFSREVLRRCGLKPSQRHVVIMHEANGVHMHVVFASSRRQAAEKEANTLRKLLIDFARLASSGCGVCKFCGCTDAAACFPPCSWMDPQQTVCSSVPCVKRWNAEERQAKRKAA